MAPANQARGELRLALAGADYVLKPEHARIAALDEALPLGVLGTLLDLTTRGAFKVRTLALVVQHLAAEDPALDAVVRQVLDSRLSDVATVVVQALQICAAGSPGPDSGNVVAPSGRGTASTSVPASE